MGKSKEYRTKMTPNDRKDQNNRKAEATPRQCSQITKVRNRTESLKKNRDNLVVNILTKFRGASVHCVSSQCKAQRSRFLFVTTRRTKVYCNARHARSTLSTKSLFPIDLSAEAMLSDTAVNKNSGSLAHGSCMR